MRWTYASQLFKVQHSGCKPVPKEHRFHALVNKQYSQTLWAEFAHLFAVLWQQPQHRHLQEMCKSSSSVWSRLEAKWEFENGQKYRWREFYKIKQFCLALTDRIAFILLNYIIQVRCDTTLSLYYVLKGQSVN